MQVNNVMYCSVLSIRHPPSNAMQCNAAIKTDDLPTAEVVLYCTAGTVWLNILLHGTND